MGNLDVRIRHGGGGGGNTALIVLGSMAVMAVFGGSLATVGAAVGSIVTTVAIAVAIVLGAVLVATVVLGIVFRKQLAARFRPSPVVWKQIGPDRSPTTPPSRVPQEVHLHYHAGPNGLIQQMPAWSELFPTTYDRPELEVEPDAARNLRNRSSRSVPPSSHRA